MAIRASGLSVNFLDFPGSIFTKGVCQHLVYDFPLGYLIASGPFHEREEDIIFLSVSESIGAATFIPGMIRRYEMSNMP